MTTSAPTPTIRRPITLARPPGQMGAKGFWNDLLGLANVSWLILLPLAFVMVMIFSVQIGTISAGPFFALMLSLGMVVLYTQRRLPEYLYLRNLFLAVFAFRVITAIAFYYAWSSIDGVPFYGARFFGDAATDAEDYYRWGIQATELPFWDYFQLTDVFRIRYHGYIYTLSFIERFSGLFMGDSNSLNARMLNAAVTAFIAVIVAVLGKRRMGMGQHVSLGAAYIFAIYPAAIMVSADVTRDTIVSLLVLLSVVVFEQIRTRPYSFLQMATFALLLLTLFQFRFESILPLLVVCFSAFVLGIFQRTNNYSAAKFAMLGLLGVTIVISTPDIAETSVIQRLVVDRGIVGYTERILEYNVAGDRSAAALILNLQFPWSVIGRVVYRLILPLPIWGSSFDANWSALSAIIWYPLLPFAVLSVWHGLWDGRRAAYAFTVLIYLIGVALTSLNERHAMQYMPLFFLFAVEGISEHYRWFRRWLIAMPAILVFLYILYAIFKGFL